MSVAVILELCSSMCWHPLITTYQTLGGETNQTLTRKKRTIAIIFNHLHDLYLITIQAISLFGAIYPRNQHQHSVSCVSTYISRLGRTRCFPAFRAFVFTLLQPSLPSMRFRWPELWLHQQKVHNPDDSDETGDTFCGLVQPGSAAPACSQRRMHLLLHSQKFRGPIFEESW